MNQIFFFLPLVCLKGINYKLEYLQSEVSHGAPGLLSSEPHSWDGGQAVVSLFPQSGSQIPARDDPALLFKAIQLRQCTETALSDLNIKFYSFFFFFHFFPRGAREGRMVSNVHFF